MLYMYLLMFACIEDMYWKTLFVLNLYFLFKLIFLFSIRNVWLKAYSTD